MTTRIVSVAPGWTTTQVLDNCIVDPWVRPYARVYLRGIDVTDIEGFHVQANDQLVIGVNPQGKVLGAIAMIAIAVAAPWAAAALAPTLSITSAFGIAALTAGISMVGAMAVSALIKPAQPPTMSPSARDADTHFLTAQSNRANPYGVVPRVYGRMKVFPQLAANPIVDNIGTISKFSTLYDFGMGDVDVDQTTLLIGDTPASVYSPELFFHQNTQNPALRVVTQKVGYDQFQYKLPNQNDTVTIRTKLQTIASEVNITFERGLIEYDNQGQKTNHTAQLLVEWAPVGTTTWTPIQAANWSGATASDVAGAVQITNNTSSPFVVLASVVFPAAGQYDIRITRVSTVSTDSRIFDDSTVTLLESKQAGQVVSLARPHTMMEMRVQASDRLSGQVQNLSAMCTSRLRTTTDGTTFTVQPSRNPAWVCVDILTGVSTPRPLKDSQIEWSDWIALAQYCDQQITRTVNGVSFTMARHTADFIVSSDTTVQQLLESVLSGCRASLRVTVSGKYGVFVDQKRTLSRQVITPANSWGFSGSRSFVEVPHAFRVSYMDGDKTAGSGLQTWQDAEIIVYNDGYDSTNATIFEDLSTFGITDYVHAWSYGRYMMAQGIQRNESFSVTMDIENLACQRGDLIELAHDVPRIGGQYARVLSVAGSDVTIDTALATTVQGYTVRTEKGVRTGLITANVDADTFTLDDVTDIQRGDLIILGQTNRVSTKYIVSSITPGGDFSATLNMVKYVPEIYDADTGSIPAWNPILSNDLINITNLQVTNLQVSAQTFYYVDRQPWAKLNLTWGFTGFPASHYEVEVLTADGKTQVVGPVNEQNLEWVLNLLANSTKVGQVQFTVTPFTQGGVKGTAASVTTTVKADTTAPAPVLEFAVNVQDMAIQIWWEKSLDEDIDFHEIRYSPDPVNGRWAASQLIAVVPYNMTRISVGARTGLYFIQSIDTSGNRSIIQSRRTTVEILPNINLMHTINDKPGGWQGSLSGVQVVGSTVQSTGAFGQVTKLGYYYFKSLLDLGEICEVRLSSKIEAHGATSDDIMAKWIPLSIARPLARANSSQFNAILEYRVANKVTVMADWTPKIAVAVPIGGAGSGWSEWRPITVGDITGRIVQFRVKMESFDQRVRPVLDNGLIEIDVVDRVWKSHDIAIAATGTRVNFDPAFIYVPTLAITVDDGTAIRYVVENRTAEGVDVQLFDNGNKQIAGRVDIAALGWGRKRSAVI